MTTTSQQRLATHDVLADRLSELSGAGLHKKRLKDYIVLERTLGKTAQNKNAISFLREGVSFMVRDLGVEERDANLLGLNSVRGKNFPRLLFPNLTLMAMKYELVSAGH